MAPCETGETKNMIAFYALHSEDFSYCNFESTATLTPTSLFLHLIIKQFPLLYSPTSSRLLLSKQRTHASRVGSHRERSGFRQWCSYRRSCIANKRQEQLQRNRCYLRYLLLFEEGTELDKPLALTLAKRGTIRSLILSYHLLVLFLHLALLSPPTRISLYRTSPRVPFTHVTILEMSRSHAMVKEEGPHSYKKERGVRGKRAHIIYYMCI